MMVVGLRFAEFWVEEICTFRRASELIARYCRSDLRYAYEDSGVVCEHVIYRPNSYTV